MKQNLIIGIETALVCIMSLLFVCVLSLLFLLRQIIQEAKERKNELHY